MSEMREALDLHNPDEVAAFMSEWLRVENGDIYGVPYIAVQIAETADRSLKANQGSAHRPITVLANSIGQDRADLDGLLDRLIDGGISAITTADFPLIYQTLETALSQLSGERKFDVPSVASDEAPRGRGVSGQQQAAMAETLPEKLYRLHNEYKIAYYGHEPDLHKAILLRVEINEACFANLDKIIGGLAAAASYPELLKGYSDFAQHIEDLTGKDPRLPDRTPQANTAKSEADVTPMIAAAPHDQGGTE